MRAPLLTVRDLRTSFRTRAGDARAVDGVSFTIAAHETVGLVGESGCGKSATALSILGLIRPPGRVHPGSHIEFGTQDLVTLPEDAMRDIRGSRIAMVFQEPMTSLNPVLTVGEQIAEVARAHEGASARVAWDRAVAMLETVGIGDPARRARDYPHHLSGGMRQRVMIAMALLLKPSLLIADEATTALDVTIQAQILELLGDLQARFGMAVLLISHDLGVIAERAKRVLVMYAGQIVEEAPTRDLFTTPHHPYTHGLLDAMPRLGARRDRLLEIPGSVPAAADWPGGCRFHPRCPFAWDRCRTEAPPLYRITGTHYSRCHLQAEPARRAPAASAR